VKWEQRNSKKSKNGKPTHRATICDLVPRKNTKYAIPRFKKKLFTKNGTKQEFTWLSTQVIMVCGSFIANF
jgi:hypothetical protein